MPPKMSALLPDLSSDVSSPPPCLSFAFAFALSRADLFTPLKLLKSSHTQLSTFSRRVQRTQPENHTSSFEILDHFFQDYTLLQLFSKYGAPFFSHSLIYTTTIKNHFKPLTRSSVGYSFLPTPPRLLSQCQSRRPTIRPDSASSSP